MKRIVGTLSKLLPIIFSVLMYTGCTKDDEVTSTPDTTGASRLELSIQHLVDESPLEPDTLKYTNAAGYPYSVTKLHYYLDSFVLISNTQTVYVKGTFEVDANKSVTKLLLDSIPVGQYTGIKFLIGLRPSLNITNGLPITAANLKMVWPEEMGGGYHFLMMEGHYLDTAHKINGYTFHLGTNNQRIEHNTIPIALKITGEQTSTLTLGMHINEWFVHPYRYDFAISGNHIMGIDSSMQKIRNNGKDVFKNL